VLKNAIALMLGNPCEMKFPTDDALRHRLDLELTPARRTAGDVVIKLFSLPRV
jgi:hypothetical protein